MKARGLAQATIRSQVGSRSGRSTAGLAEEEDEIDENPMLGVKVGNAPPPKIPGDDDLALLLRRHAPAAGSGNAETPR